MREWIKKHKVPVIVIAVIVLVVIVIAAVVFKIRATLDEVTGANDGILVQELQMQDLSKSIQATGTVESQNTVEVTSEISGKIAKLNVSLGDHVNRGDVLCVFEDTQIREQIARLEQQQAKSRELADRQNQIAQRGLDQARMAMDAANAQVESAQKAYDADVAAKRDTKASKAALQEAKAVQAEAFGALQSAQDAFDANALGAEDNTEAAEQLAELYRQLQQVSVVAEQSGIVTQLNISQGSVPNGALMVIQDDSNLKVKVSVKEKDILNLREGMTAKITASAIENEEYGGKVQRVINFAVPGGGEMQGESSGGYSAEVYVDAGSRLLLGMAVKVEITLNESGKKLAVPYDSIATDDDGADYVYRAVPGKDGKSKIERVSVTQGEKNDYYTQVISDDLKEGDRIVCYPYEVSEGDEVKTVTPEESNASEDGDSAGGSVVL